MHGSEAQVDERALEQAQALQRRKEEGGLWSKTQLKKYRRKLSKLYHKALGHEGTKPARAKFAQGLQQPENDEPQAGMELPPQAALTEAFSQCSQPSSLHSTLFPPETLTDSTAQGGSSSAWPLHHSTVAASALQAPVPAASAAVQMSDRAPNAAHRHGGAHAACHVEALPHALAIQSRKRAWQTKFEEAAGPLLFVGGPPQGAVIGSKAQENGHINAAVAFKQHLQQQQLLPHSPQHAAGASQSSVQGTVEAFLGTAAAIVQGPPHSRPGPPGHADLSSMMRLLQAELQPPAAPPVTSESTAPLILQQPTASTGSPHTHQGSQYQAEALEQKDQQQDQPLGQDKQQQKRPHQVAHNQRHQQQQQQTLQGGNAQKKPRKTYIYGNYHGYYGYRRTAAFQDDPRLCLLRPEWFEGRHMLDVGCNEGLITLAVATQFNCASTTGVDIDRDLISKACRNLRQMRTDVAEQIREAGAGISRPTIPASLTHPQPSSTHSGSRSATPTNGVGMGARQQQGSQQQSQQQQEQQLQGYRFSQAQHPLQQAQGSQASFGGSLASGGSADNGDASSRGAGGQAGRKAGQQSPWERLRRAAHVLSRVEFKTSDWANEGNPDEFMLKQGASGSKRQHGRGRYGVVMCLSVTKWVHLNWGDAGLMRLFTKFWHSLEPGGLLVLEPQPWRSYCQAITKKQTSAVPFRNLDTLQLRPKMFVDTLTRMGFQLLANLNEGSTAIGFSRPMFVFLKPASPSASIHQLPAPEPVSQGTKQAGSQQQSKKQQHPSPSSERRKGRKCMRQGEGTHSKLSSEGEQGGGGKSATGRGSASSLQQSGSKAGSRGSFDHKRQLRPEDLLELPKEEIDEEEEGV